ncbi:aminotransferase class V [Kribbella flavida DSM 17836]|uniref:Aminotransferase class V n=1 Tax=Kribbella flavida (strain DSM 17836 / JCM 10339 / NBRC 14399) TaxID=479435 RepID=D2PZ50_KRIFD|nr:aminotransferase class V-fold PLP-dependent enzyme [Kribbella flavida]ADB31844.1 aminotransferase class V [Kribbella flavida DSM 17836]
MSNRTYLDAASAEDLHPAAREVLLQALDSGWADPARLHHEGRTARLLLDNARAVLADAVGVRPEELFLTTSGTAAIHAGLPALAAARRRIGTTVVHSAVEHSAVLHAAATAGTPYEVGVDSSGRVDLEAFAAQVARPGVAVAALQAANHEVGTRQPIAEAAEASGAAGVPLFVDAAASLGREEVPAGWSALVASAHKWGGPAGVGLLAVRKGTRLVPAWPVDEREDGLSPGHPNVPATLAAAAALQARRQEAVALDKQHRAWIAELRTRVAADVPDVEVVGDPEDRLPHVLTFSCLYVDGEALVTALDAEGFSVSSGSACTASTLRPSHVLAAMGVLTHGNVRVSLGRNSTHDDIDRFAAVLPGLVQRIRAEVGM